MDIADELINLAGRGDIGDFNRVTDIMNILHNQRELKGNDFFALEEGKKYVREMQKLLDQEKQRQDQ